MQETLGTLGNPSSIHAEGRKAQNILRYARQQVADCFALAPEQVVFTSGGTEANNLVLMPGRVQPDGMLFVGATEHVAVLEGHKFTADKCAVLPVDAQGRLKLKALVKILDEAGFERQAVKGNEEANRASTPAFMVSLMAANNETGVCHSLREVSEIVHDFGGILHSDAVQLPGRMNPLEVCRLGADFVTISAHKMGGPQGVGAILTYGTRSLKDDILIAGGGQEWRQRGGTQNLAGIAGFGEACLRAGQALMEKDGNGVYRRMCRVAEKIEEGLRKLASDIVIMGGEGKRVGNTVCFALPGLKAQTLLMNLDLAGIAVSAGSACSSGKVAKSHVLEAMGVDDELASCVVRVSTGWTNKEDDADYFLQVMKKIISRCRVAG